MTDMMQLVKMDAYRNLRGLTPEQEDELAVRWAKYEYTICRLVEPLKHGELSDMVSQMLRLDRSDMVYNVLVCIGEKLAAGISLKEFEVEVPEVYWLCEGAPIDSFLTYYVIYCLIDAIKLYKDKRCFLYERVPLIIWRKFPERILEKLKRAEEMEESKYREEYLETSIPKLTSFETVFCVYGAKDDLGRIQEKLRNMCDEEYIRTLWRCEPKELLIIKGLGAGLFQRILKLKDVDAKYYFVRTILDIKDEAIEDKDVARFWRGLSECT